MGGKSKQKTDTSLDPWSKQQYTIIAGQVQNTLSANPFQAYSGSTVAPLNPLQTQAADYFAANLGAGRGMIGRAGQMATDAAATAQARLAQASDAARAAGGYQPANVSAASFAGANLDPYLNP